MPSDPVDLSDYRKRRARQQASERERLPALLPGEVHCVRCHAAIAGAAVRCPQCGIHFNNGRAADFAPRSRKWPVWVRVLLAVLILSLVLSGIVLGPWL